MMLVPVALVSLVLGLTSAVEDFSDELNGFEFIYHRDHNLLLVVHGSTCYYTWAADDPVMGYLQDHHRMSWIENNIAAYIETSFEIMGSDDHFSVSDLEEVTNRFSDVLANYHCAGKRIVFAKLPVYERLEQMQATDSRPGASLSTGTSQSILSPASIMDFVNRETSDLVG